ncbi:MAG: hypothetical protein AB200_00125 [Parcubacteria bacterium C7867-005]|nr:MAG: hypothetical protein AB200_00125 [Parcubacteria bacterium C7867-005]
MQISWKSVLIYLALFMGLGASELGAQQMPQSALQRGRMAVPNNAEIDKYPLKDTVLTQAEMSSLGVRADTLEADWTGYNWFRNVRRFAYETLPKGTIVLVDGAGKVRYKADCGNRLVEKEQILNAMVATNTMPDSLIRLLLANNSARVTPELIKEIILRGTVTLNHEFSAEFFQTLAAAIVAAGQPAQPVPPFRPSDGRSYWSKHKPGIIIGGVLLAGGLVALAQNDWCLVCNITNVYR